MAADVTRARCPVTIDRDAALKEAEQLLRQGKLDGAVEAYVRLVEDRPSDWNSADALGDPSLGAGDVERAIAQFTRVADQFFSDSSLQKAAALYKRALEAEGNREPAPRRLGEIEERRGPEADIAAAGAAGGSLRHSRQGTPERPYGHCVARGRCAARG